MSVNVAVFNAVVLLALVNVDLTPGYFFDPRVDEAKYRGDVFGSDSVPVVREEKIVLGAAQTPASSIVVLVNIPFSGVVQEVREYLGRTMGITAAEDISTIADTSPISEKTREVSWGAWPVFGKNLSKLKALGISVDPPKQYKFVTGKYKIIEKLEAYSIMEVYILDASSFLGKSHALIVMRRTDHSREWAYIRHPLPRIPLPWKVTSETTLVTDTEIGFWENILAQKQGRKAKYFVPSPVYQDKEYWAGFMKRIIDASLQF